MRDSKSEPIIARETGKEANAHDGGVNMVKGGLIGILTIRD
jgi:hypothetical protein